MASTSRDKPLSKEEQEEEEMRAELTKYGIQSDNMPKKEMSDIIKAIKASEKEANKTRKSPTPPPSNDFESIHSNSDLLENNAIRSPSPFSFKETQGTEVTFEKNCNNKETSPSVINKSFRNNFNHDRKSPESQLLYSKNTNYKNDFPPLESYRYNTRNKVTDGSKDQFRDKKLTQMQTKRNTEERWKLNPFQFENIDDTPLPELERDIPRDEDSLLYNCEDLDLNDEEIFESLCLAMNAKLEKLREQYTVPHTREKKWGSPIKVAFKWNGSTDKNPDVPENAEPLSSPDPVVPLRITHDRATKRKALSTIAAAINNESSDENSDDEFLLTKRRKCPPGGKAEETAKRNKEKRSTNKNSNKIVETIDVDDNMDQSDTEMFDNSEIFSLRKKPVTKDSASAELEEQKNYPRRIPPPNPSKEGTKGFRGKKNSKQQNSLSKKVYLNDEEISKTVNDEEIKKTLNEINVHLEDANDNDGVDFIQEIKPAPLDKSLKKKLQIACVRLETTKEKEEQKNRIEEEIKKRKEKEKEVKRNEIISKRLEEEENERIAKLEKERKCNEQTSFYNTILNSKQGVTSSNFNRSNRTFEDQQEEMLLEGDDEEFTITHSNVVTKACPICLNSFPCDEIERHASECNAFSSVPDDIRYQPSTSRASTSHYECQICNKFQTRYGNDLDEHVVRCKQKAEDSYRNDVLLDLQL